MEEKLNIIQKLAKIRAMSDVVSKDKRGFNYSYADIINILAKITAGMKKYGVSLIPQIVPGTARIEAITTTNTKFDKKGSAYDNTVTEMLVRADMLFRWVNDDDKDDYIDVPWFVTGSQTDPSQAFGAGLTYCTRYFLTSYFQIAQSDLDVDAYRSKQKEAEATEEKYIAEQIIKEFDSTLKSFLADNAGKSDEIKQFISKYAKGGNYFAIKESSLASKLMNDFKNKYMEE